MAGTPMLECPMFDLLYLGLGVSGFALMAAYVRFVERA